MYNHMSDQRCSTVFITPLNTSLSYFSFAKSQQQWPQGAKNLNNQTTTYEQVLCDNGKEKLPYRRK